MTKPVLQQELKKLEKKLTGKIDQIDKSLLSFKGEVDDKFQKVEDRITQSEGRVMGVLSDAMGELKTIRESQEIITGRVYENVDKLENHETRITSLEQVALAG